MSDQQQQLFSEFETHFDVSFWYELERLKLGSWRLETPTVRLVGEVPDVASAEAAAAQHRLHRVALSNASFSTETATVAVRNLPVSLVNHNTIEDLKAIDRHAAVADAVLDVARAIHAGAFSTSAAPGAVRTFADLKKHTFSFATAFPVIDLPSKPAVKSTGAPTAVDGAMYTAAVAAVQTSPTNTAAMVPQLVLPSGAAAPLTKAAVASLPGDAVVTVAMEDHSADAAYPCWAWRNVVFAVRCWRPATTVVRMVCLRGSAEASKAFEVACDASDAAGDAFAQALATFVGSDRSALRVIGWAKGLRKIDLGAMMDPTRLAQSSAKLNLGLMKWRMNPDIDLDKISSLKTLLLGSGTLGCNIARHLMMWGVNHITLVDRGEVSYSNPVRQTLFELSDCTAEGENRVKSIAAARTLKRILPTCDATGVQLTIRMPGHFIDAQAEPAGKADVDQLEDLIKAHDVVFLLTDSRESRWLPTLLCAVHDKPVINSALGFDSYVVMRHGVRSAGDQRVGCYFCNDVVAPMDSLTARTLDQQCTVTRPGVSAMASALSVEVLAALCNHDKFFACPAYKQSEEEAGSDGATSDARTCIGVVPHQIRGSVSDYSSMMLHGEAYAKCTACSDIAVNAYREQGWPFILRCLNEPKYMEEVTGLKAEREALAEKYADWDDDDFDDDDDDDA